MNKLLTILAAITFSAGSAAALAADPPKAADTAKEASAKLVKPANVTPEAWAKMSDAEKKKAAAESTKSAEAAPEKKKKKGGC